jgi:tripartite-type tricarboxylate transporter receptor subunit TctC
VRLVVAFPPGSGTDVLARIVAPAFSREIGQPVVIDNRAGGNGIVGTQSAALSPADGYTLLIISTSAASINPHTVRRLPYDPARDFAMIGSLAEAPYVLCVHPDGARDLPGFLDTVREKNGEATFSHGNASALIMTTVMARKAGLRMTAVPYRGGAEALAEVAAGRIDCNFADFGPGSAQARGGRVRILAHSLGGRPFPAAEGVPGVDSLLPGFDMSVWWGFAAPAGTPPEIIERANRALNAALATPEVVERLTAVGDAPLSMGAEEFSRYVARQRDIWGEHVRTAGIEPQ